MIRGSILLFSIINIVSAVDGPLTQDFEFWLKKNLYTDDFQYLNYGKKGSYGGRNSANSLVLVVKTPVIFIHGNSDSALNSGGISTGWENTIEYFLQKGYTTAELYATSWGDTNPLNAAIRVHDCKTVLRLRRFVEAVIKYTGATKVSIITHSMGVTLGRKIIKGGQLDDENGGCSVGESLRNKIDVFIGLSGANYGLCNCESAAFAPTCSRKNGFWPGDQCGFNINNCGVAKLPFPCSSVTYSKLLMDMNTGDKEADYVFSAWSSADDLIMYGDIVWGRPTSLIPKSTGQKTYTNYTHMETKERTAADQYSWVTNKPYLNL